jgi:hypothetical protein
MQNIHDYLFDYRVYTEYCNELLKVIEELPEKEKKKAIKKDICIYYQYN